MSCLECVQMENLEPETKEYVDKREMRDKPEVSWLAGFTKSLRQIIDSSDICMFDRYIREFVEYLRSEVPSNVSGQLHIRSLFIVKQVQICMCFFSNFYQDSFKIFNESVYNVRMMELLPLYLDLKLVSFGTRMNKAVEVAERIATTINVFLNKNLLQASEVLLHLTKYWIAPWFNRIKELLLCLFRKLLNHQMKPAGDIEYVQYILLYRLWMAIAKDKAQIVEIKRHCLSHLTLPNNMQITRTMIQIFPPLVPLKSIQTMLIVDFDIFPVIQAFLQYVISLRNNSILGIDLTPGLLVSNKNAEEENVQFDSLLTCFDEYVNSITESFKQSSEIQESMSNLMNRLIANSSLDASRDYMTNKQIKQMGLITSQRRERLNAHFNKHNPPSTSADLGRRHKAKPPEFSLASSAESGGNEQDLEHMNGEQQTSLPLKKRRKLSVFQASEEYNKQPLVHGQDEDVSYPATPMMSIAEVKLLQSIQQLQEGNKGEILKTPGQLKFIPEQMIQFNNQGNNTSNFQINSQVSVMNDISFNSNQYINNNFGSDVTSLASCPCSIHGNDCKQVNCVCLTDSNPDDEVIKGNIKKPQRRFVCTTTD